MSRTHQPKRPKALWTVLWVLALCLGLPGACAERGIVGGDCQFGLSVCEGECVNIGSSVDHCGDCGNACGSNEECLLGNCRSCDAGETLCDGQCVDTGTSEEHCGFCENPCDDDQTCLGGMCRVGFPDGGDPGGGPGPGQRLTDGGILLPDGNVVPFDPGACTPPYNSAERCGDCNTACADPTPFCAPSEDTFRCVGACEDPLVLCGDQCADLTSDPSNCGRCSRLCPTGICQDSECVGEFPGHIVLSCISHETFQGAFADAPQTTVLGNAVSLTKPSDMRILLFQQFASGTASQGVQTALNRAIGTGRYELSAASASQVPDWLSIENFDVFIVLNQSNAVEGQMAELGAEWAEVMDDFALLGGVVVVLGGTGDTGTHEMHEFIREAGLLSDISGLNDVTGTQVHARDPGDAVGVGVQSPFIGLPSTCTYETDDLPSENFSFVVTDTPEGGGELGKPVVLHRVRVP